MRQRVTLQNPASPESFDSFGQPIKNPQVLGTFWAEVIPLTGHALVSARQVKEQASIVIKMRHQGTSLNIGPATQALLNGRTFGLFDVRNIEERNRRYEMTAYEIQTAGPV